MKKYIKKYLPDILEIRKKYNLGFLGDKLLQPTLWHLNRFSVARAVAIGVFVCILPLPGHMVMAAIIAVVWSSNLPVALLATWVNNPFTMIPIYYLDYQIGTWLLRMKETHHFHIDFTWHWFQSEFTHLWIPMMLGGLFLGIILASLSYWIIRLTWHVFAVWRWKKRSQERAEKS